MWLRTQVEQQVTPLLAHAWGNGWRLTTHTTHTQNDRGRERHAAACMRAKWWRQRLVQQYAVAQS
jgi:hypothetical protein